MSSTNDKQAALQQLLAQRVLARRRLLQFTQLTHPAYSSGWVHDDICRRLEKFSQQVAERKSPRLMLLMPPRHGKLLADSTEVYTKEGWKTHGTLKVGDEVLGLHDWTTVVKVSRRGWATHFVVTNAGTRILAHENHEWAVLEYKTPSKTQISPWRDTRHYIPRVVETNEFIETKERFGDLNSFVVKPNKPMRRYYLPQQTVFKKLDYLHVYAMRGMRKPNNGRLSIVDVYEATPDEVEWGRCIQVSAEDGIYLVTRDLVPTHNSELASIRFPAWHLGHNPAHEIINVGYNLELPMKFSRKVREVVRDPHYKAIFPDTQLDPESQSVEAWNTTRGGGFVASGVGGGITGKGCHILIIDDPIKNQEEADSILVRDKLWDWFQSTAYTRLAPGGGILAIETFWNEDDLAGRIQLAMATDPEADQYEIVKYPALSESWEYRDEQTGKIHLFDEEQLDSEYTLLRPKDFCLHEARYPTESLKRIKSNLQSRIWSALYQQNPTPDEGMYFKREYFRYQKAMPRLHEMQVLTAWDFAIGEKQANDWTVGATVLQDETDTLYVLEIFRMKGDSFQIVEAMLDAAARWGSIPSCGYMVGAEDGQIWRAIEPLFKKRMNERRQYPPYEVLRPMTDKLARARPLQGRMQQGRVVFPEDAPWRAQAEQELLHFPAGAHDDVVDALAWAAQMCLGREPPRLAEPPPVPSWRDRIDIDGTNAGHMSA